MIGRRVLLGGAAALLAAAAAPTRRRPAAATACDPLRGATVSLVVPYSAGGGFDAYARLLAPHLAARLSARLVVRNVTGAGSLIGSRAIRDAPADGRTLGIVDGTRLVVRAHLDAGDTPSPLRDLAVLAQLVEQGNVWIVAAASPIAAVEQLWAAQRGPVVVGTTGLAAEEIAETALPAEQLGIEVSYVGGYRGSQEAILALLRGDIDLFSVSLETALRAIESGEARPILQLGDRPLAAHPALAGVPVLAGAHGLASRRAEARGRSAAEARRLAGALVGMVATTRLMVAPGAIEPGLRACLEDAVLAAASAPELQAEAAKAGRALDILPGAAAVARLRATEAGLRELRPMLDAVRRKHVD